MPLTDLVAPQAVVPALKVNSKKQAIQELAARAAELTGQSEREILEILQQRERSARPASATASRFRTASCPSSSACSGCSRGSTARSISMRSTASRWI